MSGIPNAPPFPVSYSAHTDIQLRDLYARVQGIERTVTIIEGQPVEVDFGTVRLMAIRPPTVAAVNIPYNRGWWQERDDPFRGPPDPVLLASLKAPAIVLSITGSISEQFLPLYGPLYPSEKNYDELNLAVCGWARGHPQAQTRIRPNFAVAKPAFKAQGGLNTYPDLIGFAVEFKITDRNSGSTNLFTGLPPAEQNVGRVLRMDVDLWVGMYTTAPNGNLPFEPQWGLDQKGSIDVVVTYVDSTLDRKKTTIHPINELSEKVLLELGPFWELP